MPAVRHHVRPQVREIGFPVRRLLPAAVARSVGPFVFLDHMGPATFPAGTTEGDVRPHPHVGLATVTALFEGAILHRDSLGYVQRIEPGAVNWMTAGRGIVHSERFPDDIRARGGRVHGLQFWVALPAAHEDAEPAFVHHPAHTLPAWTDGGASVRLLVGEAYGRRSPVVPFSPTLFLTATLAPGAALRVEAEAAERAIYAVDGPLRVDDEPVEAHTLAVLEPGVPVTVTAPGGATLAVVGGAPLDGPRFLRWNFVATSRERIEAAEARWAADAFPAVPGETERIPLPG